MNFSRQVALFKQAMQTEGNSGFHYLLTFLMMSISFILLFFVGLTGSGAKGLYMLSLISSVNVFFVTVATVSLFCTSVTEEKEHNTLGVLLMTGISPFGFLTGKLISRLYMVLKLILLQVPFIVFARTLGGLSMDQIMAHLVYFLAIVVVMSQVGMFFSIISQRSSAAIFFTSVTLLILGSFPCNDSASFMSYYFKIFETGFAGAVFSQPVFLLAVFSIAVFLSSIMLFSKSAFDEGSGGLSQEVSILKSAKRDRYKTNPIFEKDFRYLAGYRLGLIIRSVIAFLLAFSTNFVQFGDFAYPIAVGWMYCECIYYSQVMVKSEKKAATLSTLGILPVSPKSILNQKYKALLVSTAPSLVLLFYLCVIKGNEFLPGLLVFGVMVAGSYAHFLIAAICSLRYEKMSLLISVLFILLYSLLCGPCPIGWLLFLPSIVILSVNFHEKFEYDLRNS